MHLLTQPARSVFLTIVSLSLCCAGATCSTAEAQTSGGVIDRFTKQQIVSGNWKTVDGELVVGDEPASRAIIAAKTPSSYSLTIEFTRREGTNSIGAVLPVGSSQCAFLVSVFNGEAHGIGAIDGQLAKANASTIKPGVLENGHPYRLLIEVDVKGDSATISSTLDGRAFVKWSGKTTSLSMLDMWKLPSTENVGLVTYAPTTFHSISLTPLDPKMRMTQPKSVEVVPTKPTEDATSTVVYDQSHGEPAIEGLMEFASNNGFTVKTLNTAISAEELQQVDLLYIRAPKTRFSRSEVEAVIAFIRRGGSLLLVMDEERRTSLNATAVNDLIKPFGLAFADDTPYLHNCGAICPAGDIHSVDREVPFSGGRAVTGGQPFGFQLDKNGERGQPFATSKDVAGGGRIIILGDGMAAGLMGTPDGQRLSGVSRDPTQTTYWGKDSSVFLTEVIAWTLKNE
ncbi:motility-associated ABC transporter substrate-binding family protein [Neorhodopirellula pilleata]|uniref:ABC-type uncharacterized transport system n=1 Tax=Neorhodopirellula pilleata TaxID=2714738 RepID=A0A5C5ZH73_9BACT|nr:hypothetical protein [Neorhodopirellula pilleata]TWT86221.1 ABC-type uncharacterized transport system [Neorhodopirellula pilleata]